MIELVGLVLDNLVDVVLARLQRCVNDHRKHDVDDSEVHRDEDGRKEPGCFGSLLDDGDRHQAPAVACDDLLREGEDGVADAAEGMLAAGAAVVRAGKADPLIHRVDEVHCADAPNSDDNEEQRHSIQDCAGSVCETLDHQGQLRELHHDLVAPGQPQQAKDSQHCERGQGICSDHLECSGHQVKKDHCKVHDVEGAEKESETEDKQPRKQLDCVQAEEDIVHYAEPRRGAILSVRFNHH
mmetsp:Transcript_6817/g.18409  ORF Transcript_6817/g.18409 Transcript_6817/m.18409 type:complete len:240 (+) Transcript_6817:524-1243(+)